MFHWRELVYYGMLFLLTALLMCELKLLWRSVYIKIYSLCRYALTNIFLCFYVVLTSILSCLIRTFISWCVQSVFALFSFPSSPERKSVTDVWAEAVVTIFYIKIYSLCRPNPAFSCCYLPILNTTQTTEIFGYICTVYKCIACIPMCILSILSSMWN